MVREEVKKAAKDDKTTLLFPTGETAMKIEGLGSSFTWRTETGYVLEPEKMKVGDIVNQGEGDFEMGQDWIITDVLGDGKFKAISKREAELQLNNYEPLYKKYIQPTEEIHIDHLIGNITLVNKNRIPLAALGFVTRNGVGKFYL